MSGTLGPGNWETGLHGVIQQSCSPNKPILHLLRKEISPQQHSSSSPAQLDERHSATDTSPAIADKKVARCSQTRPGRAAVQTQHSSPRTFMRPAKISRRCTQGGPGHLQTHHAATLKHPNMRAASMQSACMPAGIGLGFTLNASCMRPRNANRGGWVTLGAPRHAQGLLSR